MIMINKIKGYHDANDHRRCDTCAGGRDDKHGVVDSCEKCGLEWDDHCDLGGMEMDDDDDDFGFFDEDCADNGSVYQYDDNWDWEE